MRARELPARLGPIFSVREAAAAGVSPQRLRAGDLTVPFRGVRDRSGSVGGGLDEWQTVRAEALRIMTCYAKVMPDDQFFCGSAAALATLAELRASVGAGRRPGVILLRDAVELVRPRSASPGETRCRLEIVFAGMPEPELNPDVTDDAGRFVACADMVFRRERVIVEYEGDHHRTDPVQWARDIERHERLRASGWTVVRITKQEAYVAPWELVRRVRSALADRRG